MAKQAKYWQTKKFKELEREWYFKLKGQGFQDAEVKINDLWHLKQRAENSYRGASEVQRESKQVYYGVLSQNYEAEIFNRLIDAVVMRKRCLGIPIVQISGVTTKHRHTVTAIIRAYEVKWGIKKLRIRFLRWAQVRHLIPMRIISLRSGYVVIGLGMIT